MVNDRKIIISSAGNRRASNWPQQTIAWSVFAAKLKTPVRGIETLKEYLRLPKSKQDDLKDVGGFVGGAVNGTRKAANITGRDILTLDLDNIPTGETETTLEKIKRLGAGYAVYSTRKHEPVKPRLRLIMPFARTVTTEEYEPIARQVASVLGISLCDPTTFQASRLMYYPSCCQDSQFVYDVADLPLLDPDGVLSMYADWRDIASWPQVPGSNTPQKLAQKQGDPTEKPGLVGAFCRVYDVIAAMETLIPGQYEACDSTDRYTYTHGTTAGGAIVYEGGKFLYSHHATDPISGKLCNAFDLVRLHKFGELDDDVKPGLPANRFPSYLEMCRLAASDKKVTELMATERYQQVKEAFAAETGALPDDNDWIKKLQFSAETGKVVKSTDNILIILDNDPWLKGKMVLDEFANRYIVLGELPWDLRPTRRQWTDVDEAGLRHYLEKAYGLTGKDRVVDAVMLSMFQHRIDELKDYLVGLVWDRTKRLDTLLIDYLGAEDTAYTRAVSRKSLAAAVARALQPGIKFDTMTILTGPQGIGKSTFLRYLGGKWFSDSLQVFEGKDACELIQGTWINEIGELNGMTRSETNAVKQFLSKQDDIYRKAYGRYTELYPRRCVFFGTTNETEFLKDNTGGRRFWPVDCGLYLPSKSIFDDLPAEVDQIWAEAVLAWRTGESLYTSGVIKEMASEQQESHREISSKEGMIQEFVARKIPRDFNNWPLDRRRLFWINGLAADNMELVERREVSAIEIWCELFNGDIKQMRQSDAREINQILNALQGWGRLNLIAVATAYGRQRGYRKLPENYLQLCK